jgi:hypothetical protein
VLFQKLIDLFERKLVQADDPRLRTGAWRQRVPRLDLAFDFDDDPSAMIAGSWPDWCGKAKWRILPAIGSWLTQSRPPGKAATGGMRRGRAYQDGGAAA